MSALETHAEPGREALPDADAQGDERQPPAAAPWSPPGCSSPVRARSTLARAYSGRRVRPPYTVSDLAADGLGLLDQRTGTLVVVAAPGDDTLAFPSSRLVTRSTTNFPCARSVRPASSSVSACITPTATASCPEYMCVRPGILPLR